MRRIIWQFHSWLGLVAGLGLLVIGVTGSALVFRDELEALFHRELVRVEPTAEGRQPFDRLLAIATSEMPDHEITGWVVHRDEPGRADELWVIPHGSTEWRIATLDPYRGRLLASPRASTSTLTGWLLELHYALFADHAGMIATGVFGVLLCVLGITGVWVYRGFWKQFFTLRWGRGVRILFSDLHKFTGITSVVFNLLLGFTGSYWNLTHVIGEELAAAPEPPPMSRRLYAHTLSLDALAADASARLPGFQVNYISLPWMSGVDVTLYGAFGDSGSLRSPYGSFITYEPQTGVHKTTTDLRTQGLWTQIVDAFTPLHFGSFGGLPVKIIWCLAGLAPGVLATSGVFIWWHRRRRPARQAHHDAVARSAGQRAHSSNSNEPFLDQVK